jgi:hypothetical protein
MTWGLISVIWLLFNDLGKYKAIQFIISMLKQIILNNIYIGWFCLKIMLLYFMLCMVCCNIISPNTTNMVSIKQSIICIMLSSV